MSVRGWTDRLREYLDSPNWFKHILVLVGVATLVIVGLAFFASSDRRPERRQASAGNCSGVTLQPANKAVKRGGKMTASGTVCSGGTPAEGAEVTVKLVDGKKKSNVARALTNEAGDYYVCPKIKASKKTKSVQLKVKDEFGAGAKTKLKVSKSGWNRCEEQQIYGPSDPSAPAYVPPEIPAPNPDCPLANQGSSLGNLTLPKACTVVASDTAADPNPVPFWGKVDCADSSRHQHIASGGDPATTAVGDQQGDQAFRRITVIDGDDVWGERCELGYNWHEASDPGYGLEGPGPTVFYHEGMRLVTFISIRVANDLDVNDSDWRTVYQNKQAQPYDNPAMGSIFEMQVRSGDWAVISDWSEPLWTAPAEAGEWTRFAFDVVYSPDPSVGRFKVYTDLNQDGDASDNNESSPVVHRPTLLTETEAAGYAVQPGGSIPSHLRAGVYQNTNYSCPGPAGCYADFDNVQVVRP